jgi:predicted nuclease of predicted toxin-antitoxin system
MKILVDENVPRITVDTLVNDGHDVVDFRNTGKKGLSDEDLFLVAQQDQRLLITTDKGFVRNRREPHDGILIVRLRQPNSLKIHRRILRALAQFRPEEWPGLCVVMRDVVQVVYRTETRE